MKKITKILFALILCFLLINVNAGIIRVNGDPGENIYESGGSGSTTFDETTNTLTLNNYTGGEISIGDLDGETVNIILKGNNTITTTADGISTSGDNVTLNITGETGSKLTISGSSSGIFNTNGSLTITNADIEVIDCNGTAIHMQSGELLKIKDSKLKVSSGAEYGIYSDDGDMLLDNLTYTSKEMDKEDIYVADEYRLTINNSVINIEDNNLYCIAGEDTYVSNTTFNIKNSDYVFFVSGLLEVEKGTFNLEDVKRLSISGDNARYLDSHINGNVKNSLIEADGDISIYGTTMDVENDNDSTALVAFKNFIEDSDIKLSGFGMVLDGVDNGIFNSKMDVYVTSGFAQGIGVTIKDSNVKCVTDGIGIMLYGGIEIDNSDFSIESTGMMPAIVILSSGEEVDFDDVIKIKNTYLKESNYLKVSTYLDDVLGGFTGYAYSFGPNELADSYDDMEVFDLFTEVADKIHFVTTKNPKTGDNLSYYITLSILSIMTITSCYYVLNKNNLDKKK